MTLAYIHRVDRDYFPSRRASNASLPKQNNTIKHATYNTALYRQSSHENTDFYASFESDYAFV